jgi:DNA-directed RNA polymerase subunit RPC12/RpoP
MIEVYTKKNKKYMTLVTNDVELVIYKLKQLRIINAIKYLLVIKKQNLSTYYCADCKKRSYFEEGTLSSDLICTHCTSDKRLYFVGFKPSEKIGTYKYAL